VPIRLHSALILPLRSGCSRRWSSFHELARQELCPDRADEFDTGIL